MEYSINIPDYLTVKHYKDFSTLKSLDDLEQKLFVISALTEEPLQTIKSYPVPFILSVYAKLNDNVLNVEPEFYPIIEWEGKQYGYRPMHKMTMDEYVDLDNLSKDINNNINQVLAILYRPITKNKMQSPQFVTKSTFKVINGEGENGFDYYEVEKYDNEVRKDRAKEYDGFPASVALGALGFFLGTATLLSSDIPSYSQLLESRTNVPMKRKNKINNLLARITAGYISSMNWQKVPSYQSLETKHSLTLT